MRSVLAIVSVAGLIGLAGAQDKKADAKAKGDPVGTWNCSYDVGGQKRESTLTLKKDGDKFSGTMKWPDKQEAKLTDVKVKGEEVTFSADRTVMDNTFNIKYTLTVDGDSLKGKGEIDFNGESRAFDIEGKREKSEKKDK